MKLKWSKVEPRTIVELSGREWTIESIKVKKGRAKVVVTSGAHRAESKVDADEKVKVVASAPRKRETPISPPTDPRRAAPRPQENVHGDPWETPQDKTEKLLKSALGARLVAESPEGAPGYYVPPMDITTIASHLVIFHGTIPADIRNDEAAMMHWHRAEHERIDSTGELPEGALNHWHSETRPTRGGKSAASKKKGKKKGKKK